MGVALVVAGAGAGHADVLCTRKSGAVVRRAACKKKETVLDLTQFGAAAPSTVYVSERLSADGLTNAFLTPPNPIASLTLPAGAYLVVGKGSAADFDGNSSPNTFECDLRVGDVIADSSFAELGRLYPNVMLHEGVITVTAAITLAASGTVTLNCANNGAASSSIQYGKLAAVQTGAVVKQ